MKNERKTAGLVIVAVLALFIGLVLAVQIKTTAGTDQGGLVPIAKLRSYETELKELRAQKEEAMSALAEAEDRLNAVQNEKAAEDEFVQGLVSDIEKYRMNAGLTDLRGPGVEITVKDPPMQDEYDTYSVIVNNSDLLLSLVNKLKEAGAEAISINEIRVVSTTEISLAGNNININATPTASPYHVKAIGDPDTLYNALIIRGGVIDTMKKSYNLTVDMTKQEDVFIPRYTGVITFKYAVDAADADETGDAQS